MIKLSTILLAFISSIVCVQARGGSADPEAIRVIDRAVKAAIETREYSAEITQTGFVEDLTVAADGKPKQPQRFTVHGSERYRAPYGAWSHTRTPYSERFALVDGHRSYEYVSAANGQEQATVEDFIPNETGWIYRYEELAPPLLSPLPAQVGVLTPFAAWRAAPEGEDAVFTLSRDAIDVRYLGQELFGGVLCDAVEFTSPVSADDWSKARQANPSLPVQPTLAKRRVYIGTEDGLLRRSVEITEIPGVGRNLTESVYAVGPLGSDEAFTRARLDAALKSLRGDRPSPEFQERHLVAGESLPSIDALRADGKPLKWADFRGKVVVVQTWATWCVPCKKAMPYYDKIRRQLANQDVVFLALSFDQTQEAYERWLKQQGKAYGFLFARAQVTAANWERELGRLKGSLPAFYVLDRDGKIVLGYSGNGYRKNTVDPRLGYGLGLAGVKLP